MSIINDILSNTVADDNDIRLEAITPRQVSHTKFYDVGRSAAEYERMGSLSDAIDKMEKQVKSEERKDIECKMGDLQIHPGVGLVVPGIGQLDMRDSSWSHIVSLANDKPRHSTQFMDSADVELASHCFNHIMKRNKEKNIVLRTRIPTEHGDTKPALYAAVSDRYKLETGPQEMIDIMRKLMNAGHFKDYKGTVDYRGENWDIRAISNQPVSAGTPNQGDVFRAVAGLSGSDNKQGSLVIRLEQLRPSCCNMIQVNSESSEVRLRHNMKLDRIIGSINSMMINSAIHLKALTQKWKLGREHAIVDMDSVLQQIFLDQQLPGFIKKEDKHKAIIKVPGMPQEDAYELMTRAFNREPDSSVSGLVNAVTRAAHEQDKGYDTFEFLKSVGSSMLDWLPANGVDVNGNLREQRNAL